MCTPIKYFEPTLIKPSEYDKAISEYDKAISKNEAIKVIRELIRPNYTNAYICATISSLCYKSSVNAKHTDEDYKEKVISKLQQWGWSSDDAKKTIVINSREIEDEDGDKVPGTQGLIIFYKDIVFIGFRGSEKKFNDWFTNFKFLKKKSPYSETKEEHRLHKGFLEAFEAIIPEGGKSEDEFKEILKQIRGKQVWLTGHSLGGALASVASSYLLKEGIPIQGIYTFGAPRVGDAKYRDYLNKNLTYKYWRFINGNDLVADIPFSSIFKLSFRFIPFGFSREGCMLRLTETEPELLRVVDKDGKRRILDKYNGIDAKDHSMKYYRKSLLNLARQYSQNNLLEMTLDNEIDLTQEQINNIEENKPLF